MVSSGAIAEGMKRLGWKHAAARSCTSCRRRPRSARWVWRRCTSPSCASTAWRSAQVLLTHADLADRERYLNARSTLLTLLGLEVIPVINENDTVVNDEIKFGDNDTLGALVANLVEADVLVILTDQHGLYSADPRKRPGRHASSTRRRPAIRNSSGWPAARARAIGRGGMITKMLAAKRAAGSGASTVIAWGREPDVLLRLAAGEAIGTALVAPDAEAGGAQAVDGRTTCSCAARSSSTTVRRRSCATKARACCRSAWSSVVGRLRARRRDRGAHAAAAPRSRAAWPTTQRRGAAASRASRQRRSSAVLGYVGRAGDDPPRQPRADWAERLLAAGRAAAAMPPLDAVSARASRSSLPVRRVRPARR